MQNNINLYLFGGKFEVFPVAQNSPECSHTKGQVVYVLDFKLVFNFSRLPST